MAGGYRAPKDILDVLQSLQRQINQLRATAGIRSGVIGGGGSLVVEAPGTLSSQHLNGQTGVEFGAMTPNPPFQHGLTLRSDDAVLRCWFGQMEGDGVFSAGLGTAQGPLDNFAVYTRGGNIGMLDLTEILGIQAENLSLEGGADGMHLYSGIGDGIHIWDLPTTGSSANVFVSSTTGVVSRSTSSRRYKQDIEDAEIDVADVLKVRGRTWRQRSDVEADPDTEQRRIGFIAEELAELPTMRQFVNFDEQGRPDSIETDRIPVALFELAKAQQKQLDDQASKIEALTKRLDALEGKS